VCEFIFGSGIRSGGVMLVLMRWYCCGDEAVVLVVQLRYCGAHDVVVVVPGE